MVFAIGRKRYWAYTVDYMFRGALIYGGRRGIADAIDFANKNSGINYEIDDVLHELDLCRTRLCAKTREWCGVVGNVLLPVR